MLKKIYISLVTIFPAFLDLVGFVSFDALFIFRSLGERSCFLIPDIHQCLFHHALGKDPCNLLMFLLISFPKRKAELSLTCCYAGGCGDYSPLLSAACCGNDWCCISHQHGQQLSIQSLSSWHVVSSHTEHWHTSSLLSGLLS